MIGETDLNAAYWRVYEHARIAATGIAIVGILAFICLLLTFGTTPAPAKCSTNSEAEINLGNNLFADTSWDATNI